ncbi:MAG: DNA alkylation repair protein [Chloroflexi bacterium]|nr:DNA alkylation repair protein [Chloroflexota bacterium]MBU1749176.1 DNA alkylation repair protein [Chloroflexota bacterium]
MTTDLKQATREALVDYAPARARETAAALERVWLAETEPLTEVPAQVKTPLAFAGTSISVLDIIGQEVGRAARRHVDAYLPLAHVLWDEHGREGCVVAATMLGPMELADPDRLLPILREFAATCAGWEDADQLAMRAVEPIARKDPAAYLDRLAPWVMDDSPWVRRVGVTTIGRVPMKRKDRAAQCLALVAPALADPEREIVGRAVSFAIRVTARADAGAAKAFVRAHGDTGDPNAIWVLCDVIRSLWKRLLPEFADLLPIYEAMLDRSDARTRRSVESAIRLLEQAGGVQP